MLLSRDEEWSPADNVILEPNALAAVKYDVNNCIVIAGPGAGKTELLAQRACYLLQCGICNTPRRILAISFKRDSAKNLSERVEKRCEKALSMRFDSYTYDAFAKGIIDRFLSALPKGKQPARNYQIAFDKENRTRISFRTITKLAELLLRINPYIRTALTATYSHVFLDEFQDTTDLQYQLVKTVFQNSQCILTAVGDQKQRIMGWAGAMSNAFEKMIADFRAVPLELTMNHRSAPRLVEIQSVLALQLTSKNIIVQHSNKWRLTEGQCKILEYPDANHEARDLAKAIHAWIFKDGVRPRDICILAKQKVERYSLNLVGELASLGIKARIEADFQDLLAEPAVSALLGFMSIAVRKKASLEWQKTTDLLGELNAVYSKSPTKKAKQLERELSAFCSNLFKKMVYISIKTGSEEDILNLARDIFKFLGYKRYRSLFPQYSQGKYFGEIITKTCSLIWEIYAQAGDWVTALDEFVGTNSIPVLTIHKSKGLEYDSVVFIGLEDDAFWTFRDQQHEDTCSLFVALSRAKRQIYFTYSQIRDSRGNGSKEQSREVIAPLYETLQSAGISTIVGNNTPEWWK